MYIYVYIQVKGALAVLDCLFLHHLRNAKKKEKFRVHADGPLSSSCRHAYYYICVEKNIKKILGKQYERTIQRA